MSLSGNKPHELEHERHVKLVSVWLLIIIAIIVAYFMRGGITGLIVYKVTEHTKQWDFSNPAEYSYNDSLINLSNGVRLIPDIDIISIEDYEHEDYFITKALYKPDDKTNKVNTLDGDEFEVDEDRIFDIIFEEKLTNGDIIRFYIEPDDDGEIFLCNLGDMCNSPGYGVVNYEEDNEGWYNITISGLSEDMIGFNINHDEEEIEYDYIYAIHNDEEIGIVKALYRPDDRTDKVNALDGEYFEADKTKLFNIVLDNKIDNGDTIALYMKSGGADEIYICDYGDACLSPGYGKVDYDDNEGWYNITISGLSEPTKYLNIDPDEAKFNYIYAYRLINNSYETQNITYPDSAAIDTQDFAVENFGGWDLLTKDEELNGQSIDYYYSIDSGESWNLIDDFNLSSVNSSVIRIRAELISDRADTSILNSLTLKYLTSVACAESWTIYYDECAVDDTKLKYYLDENNCGTIDDLPEDNGTNVECDYCIPSWDCLSYGDCQQDSKRYCNGVIDSNNCYNITGLATDDYIGNYSKLSILCSYDDIPPTVSDILVIPNKGAVGIIINISLNVADISNISVAEIIVLDSEYAAVKKLPLYGNGEIYTGTWNTTSITEGTYLVGINVSDVNGNNAYYKQRASIALASFAKDSFTNNSVSLIKNQPVVINATEINTIIEIINNVDLNMSFSIAQYTENLKNTTPSKKPLGKYVDIIVDDTVNNNLTKATIIVYYNESEINNANIDENTLKIHYYNETSGNWQILNSSVNTTANYVWAELSHFSTYGVFGDEKVSQPPEPGGDGGGSFGGGGNVWTIPIKKTQEVKEKEVMKQPELTEEKELCSYSLSIELPEKVSFIETDTVRGVVKNSGDCDIDKVSLSLDKDIADLTFIENPAIDKISAAETKEIYLKKRKPESEKSKLLGFVVKPVENVVKSYNGELISEAIANDVVVAQKSVLIDVEVLSPSGQKILDPYLFLGLIVVGMVFFMVVRKKEEI